MALESRDAGPQLGPIASEDVWEDPVDFVPDGLRVSFEVVPAVAGVDLSSFFMIGHFEAQDDIELIWLNNFGRDSVIDIFWRQIILITTFIHQFGKGLRL